MGHPQQPSQEVRREIEERARAFVEETHGPHAAEHCRRLLEPRGAAAVEPGPSVPFLPA